MIINEDCRFCAGTSPSTWHFGWCLALGLYSRMVSRETVEWRQI
ncbi:MAG: hypothetical protein U0L49_07000 [Eubacterium sp.]|nr:hypothetical protein [Eubacterium sp.]